MLESGDHYSLELYFEVQAMRWQDLRQSTNVQDLRGLGGRGLAMGGGLATLLLLVAGWLCGVDVQPFLDMVGQQQTQQPSQTAGNSARPTDQNQRFASAVLGSTE
ncbi:MAG: neutral zinc metallopeptidase, partial [Acidobacteria bacterium]|nr:neutral zinc metallopeptidase [Acidobacteriota bacterium]